MERRLGRGLSSLLTVPEGGPEPTTIELARIRPNPDQPRKTFDPTALDELRQSIQNHGVIQPITLRRVGEEFEIIAGERRWRAARLAGLKAIPATIRDEVSDADMLELALVENLQREDLDPIERARGFQQMTDELKLTQEEVARKVGLKRATIANHLRLLDLPGSIQEAVAKGALTMGHARALLGLPDDDQRLAAAADIIEKDLSVRDIERAVRERSRPATAPAKTTTTPSNPAAEGVPHTIPPWARELQDRLRERFGTRVSIRNAPGYRGQITLDYFSREDLDRVLALLLPDL